MWRWVGIACLVYGLSSLGLMFSPRQPGPDLFNVARPVHDYPTLMDFEEPYPLPITRPEGAAQVVAADDGGHLLEWRFDSARGPLHVLILPLPCQGNPGMLALDINPTLPGRLRLGVREEHGAVYLADVELIAGWQHVSIPLSEMRPSELTPGAAPAPDTRRIMAVVAVDMRPERGRRTRRAQLVRLDNIRFE
jgi:hypothetical protein